MNQTPYYNTNAEAQPQLGQSNTKAMHQEKAVLEIFRRRGAMTPCKAWLQLGGDKFAVITSVRRAVTNLTQAGELRKTDRREPGVYGKRVHVWEIPKPEGTLFDGC